MIIKIPGIRDIAQIVWKGADVGKRKWSPWDDRWYDDRWFGGWLGPTTAGVDISESSAMQITAVYACVNLLASISATLPLVVNHRLKPRGSERAVNHPQYRLLHERPNSEMSSADYRKVSMAHRLLWGNAYSEIEYNKKGIPVAYWPLPPWRVKVKRTQKLDLYYEVRLYDGNVKNIPAYAMIHRKDLGSNGITGISRIRYAMEALGLAKATEQFGAGMFGHGINPAASITYPGSLKGDSFDKYKESVKEGYAGLGKEFNIMFLEEGMKWEKIGINPEESQFLETRKFQLNEICRLFGVPPHMVADTEKSTSWGTGIEQQTLGFVNFTLMPLLVSDEQELDYKLFRDTPEFYVEHVIKGLLRGDSAARVQFYKEMVAIGAMSPNDAREKEDENPVPGGDKYYIPLNYIEVGTEPPDKKDDNRALAESRAVEYRTALLRTRTAKSYERVFEDAAARIVERENQNVLRAAKKHLAEGSTTGWDDWLNDFYRDFTDYIRRQMSPALAGLGEAIYPIAAEEVNSEKEPTEEAAAFLREYENGLVKRYAESSRNQLDGVVKESIEKSEDTLGAIERRLDEWESKRPGQIAVNETVRLSNAVAREAFIKNGFKTFGWHMNDDCPICRELAGKTIDINSYFVGPDEVLESEKDSDIRVYKGIRHAPAHEGCTCQIVPK